MNTDQKFYDRAVIYHQSRPTYPNEIYDELAKRLKLVTPITVADIGCGTGISSTLFVINGHQVIGIEPNEDMLQTATKTFKEQPNFKPFLGSSEQTNLPDNSVDLILCAQAFHWFDVEETLTEWKRILQPKGAIVWLYNHRLSKQGFGALYEEALLQHCPEYRTRGHRLISLSYFRSLMDPIPINTWSTLNRQRFNLKGIQQRLLSSSYVSLSELEREPLMNDITMAHNQCQNQGVVDLDYCCSVYWCRI